MNERWITFDCFGTLVDWNGGFRRALDSFAGKDVDRLVENYHRIERTVESASPHVSYREVLASTLRQAAERCGIGCGRRDSEIISDSWELLQPFSDVESTLASLRQSGYRLAVLTNCDNDLFEITHSQFNERFDLVITAEDVKDYKPSLSHFRRFERMTGAGEKDWVHAACSWYHDIVPAAKLKIPSVWVDRGESGEDPFLATIRIQSASDLVEAVDRIVSTNG
ncbi:HAD hydrolase-like protein [Verrucomicrobia bacterium]|jgi:2-haloacid dehalogenase|nr:HAD hydrolase-like protein [Verrucomicrobiota bacterium]MDA7866457.1 HAD hydrolase-like protein [Verrucomicrobiota bacterium]MDB4796655.1 HAD hydrolase-like protein [bacterium]